MNALTSINQEEMVQLEQNQKSASGRFQRHETLIDTTDEGSDEVSLFGENVKIVRSVQSDGTVLLTFEHVVGCEAVMTPAQFKRVGLRIGGSF